MRINLNADAALRSLRSLEQSIEGASTESLKEIVEYGVTHAKATNLFKDGRGPGRRMRNQTRSVRISSEHFQLRNDSGHAKFIEQGTRPHRIQPKSTSVLAGSLTGRRAMLRFKANGSWVFARSVNHPGTSPRPFMAQAAEFAEYMAPFIYEEALERAIRGG